MNYLVHLYLARPTSADRLGSLLGDFVKGPLTAQYAPDIMAGIVRHRRTDAFAHTDAAFRHSKARINPNFGHYRGVMVDIFYDHFMACDWDTYHDQPLELFSQEIYRVLHAYHDQLPASLQQVAPRMIANDWLTSYRDPDIVGLVLRRIGQRIRRKNRLAEGLGELHNNYDGFRTDFTHFLVAAKSFLEEQEGIGREY